MTFRPGLRTSSWDSIGSACLPVIWNHRIRLANLSAVDEGSIKVIQRTERERCRRVHLRLCQGDFFAEVVTAIEIGVEGERHRGNRSPRSIVEVWVSPSEIDISKNLRIGLSLVRICRRGEFSLAPIPY